MAIKFTCTPEQPYRRDKPGYPRNCQSVHPVLEVRHVGVTVVTGDCDMGGIDLEITCPNCGEQWTEDGADA